MQFTTPHPDDTVAAMLRGRSEDKVAFVDGMVGEFIAQDPNAFDFHPSAMSTISGFINSSSPRRRQESTAPASTTPASTAPSSAPPSSTASSSTAPSSSASSSTASPPPPPPPPPPPSLPSSSHPGAWERGRACVINETNTYWSYGRGHGCSQESESTLENGERVYMKRSDGTYFWAVFKQQARTTLAAKANLDQMVVAVGGNPASFRTRLAKADYVLAREAPIDVVREEDEEEVFCLSFPIYLGQPASNLFWGVGRLEDGTLTMAASTQGEMERF